MNDDDELLSAYVSEGSDSAFGELVRRHIDLVYSAAVRVAGGDAHLAKDVVQVVFIDLARKAKSLPAKVLLAGWLYRHACFTASKAVRTERRRMQRETIATSMNALENDKEPSWEMIVPHLDAELNRLNRLDRDAVVLRFFKRQSFQAVGLGLGVSEDAAQMRVSRAVEKLRKALKQRGLLLTTGALVAGLSAEASVVAPGSWCVAMSTLSLAGASAVGAKFGFLSLMSAMKTKGTVAAVGAALLSVATVVVQHRQLGELRGENRALRVQSAQLESLKEENTRLQNGRIDSDEIDRLRKQQTELLRLRGETAGLRRELAEARAQKAALQPQAAIAQLEVGQAKIVDFSAWTESDLESLKTIGSGKRILLEKANPDEVSRQPIVAFRPYLCKQADWENEQWREQFLLDLPAQNEVSLCVVDRGDDDFKYIVWTALQSPANQSGLERKGE